jgi:hypothetical protein
MEPGPVFVAGLERSGTSLMYSLLASHPNLAMSRRTNLWRYFADQYGDLADDGDLEACLAVMRRYRRLQVLRIDFDRLRDDFVGGPRTYARLFELIELQHADRLGKSRWGDKSLETERHADEIMAAYPGARILHMVRDPRDRFASSQTRWRVRRGGVGAGAAEWRASVRMALEHLARHPDQYRIVTYEALATDPEAELRSICAFIGEDYTPDMLSMDGAPGFRDQGANSSYGRRRPGSISTDSIGRYRDVLTPRQVAFVDLVAGAEMARLGYEPGPNPLTGATRVRFALADLPRETARLVAWSVRDLARQRTGQAVPAGRLVDTAVTP